MTQLAPSNDLVLLKASSSPETPDQIAYQTKMGLMISGTAEKFIDSELANMFRGRIQLLLTSPPFPLNRKKKYGNLQGEAYINWLANFGPVFREFLKEDGSIVIEMGNAWTPGKPIMSTLALRALLAFIDKGQFYLCQQFICYNPARLPSPAQWVNVERIRVKDSYTHVWWVSATERPKGDNRRVLKKYNPSMIKLLESKKYNPGKRPSEHNSRIAALSALFAERELQIPSTIIEAD